ncbi:hypothetical protein NLX67_03275 [Domibacillus sp. A3M-37]|uniref:hypothetical protein n=1 Tax=Domibacillus sp. A3M-37 TaxID=2962037 RepID=UPI0020B7B59E|nr:hypothetical protein [Domibacillus sp. A3M-37]MCP3761412.1 hypothetical protein [Domibacillus sp. A3M-37]
MSIHPLSNWVQRQLPDAHVTVLEKENVIYITHPYGRKLTVIYLCKKMTLNNWYEQQDQYRLASAAPIWILDAPLFIRYSALPEARKARLRGEIPKAIFKETGRCYYWNSRTNRLTIDTLFQTRTIYFQKNGRIRSHNYDFHIPFRQDGDLMDAFLQSGRIKLDRKKR